MKNAFANRATWLFVLLACLTNCGCKATSRNTMNVNVEIPGTATRTMAVLRFDDSLISNDPVKKFIVQTVNNPDAGELLADMMSDAFTKWGKYRILSRPEVKSLIRAGDGKEDELVAEKAYTKIGAILKVDAIVLGKINAFGSSSMTIYERGNVSFTAECIDVKNGKTLWSLDADESAPYKDEFELAEKVVGETVEKLKQELP